MLSWLKRRAQSSTRAEADTPVANAAVEDAPSVLESARACAARGEASQAEAFARKAIAIRHDYADAHLLLGGLCYARGDREEAIDCLLLASCFGSNDPEPRLQLGLLYSETGHTAEAEKILREGLLLAPDHARLHNALGAALFEQERLEEAKAHFEKAVALDPMLATAHSNLGYLLFRNFERFAEGEAHVRKALEIAPGDLDALTNLSSMLPDRPHEVIEVADRLLQRDPSLDTVRLNRALSLLKLGDFERGWRDYEARKSTRCNYQPRSMPWPEWRGENLAGRGIYIHSEQGLGDEIMFASCLPEVIASAGRCVIECSPKLRKTFERSFAAKVVVKPLDDATVAAMAGEGIDCYSALGSLPRFLRATKAAFSEHHGYLKADPARIAYWRARLDALPGRLKVGMAWRGGTPSTRRSVRSTQLEQWAPLLTLPGVDFIDLQHFDCADERRAICSGGTASLHRWPDAHEEYDETAALVAALDLVVSVQTAVVHLAGALGKEAWALLPESPEWRYQQSGSAMPWYPSVKLVRTPPGGTWDGVIAGLAPQLAARFSRREA